MSLTFKEYQEKAHKTAIYEKTLQELGVPKYLYAVLGLVGESGEVAEKIKKLIRNDHGNVTKEFVESLKKELGDILWYLQEVATAFGVDLEDVASANLKKVYDRKKRGVIASKGDDR